MQRLADKVAIVTGAAGGIGLATAKRFAEEGAAVLLADIDKAGIRENAEALISEGCTAGYIGLDVTRESQWSEAFRLAEEQFGAVNILINNAGIAAQGTIEDTALDSWRHVIHINLDGTFLGCKYAIKHMQRDGGAIVNVSSIGALKGSLVGPAYGASKAGVWNLTRTLALHCAKNRYNIRCNSLHPGLTETPMMASASDAVIEQLCAGIPLGRMATPLDMANAALYLASDEARHTTGTSLVVDGGALA
ncbi:SDR family oxidoreductase [Pseudomaricurvus alkylphenolicus]|jgi:NAD(P)-dependent dehydrogenase (short-subunit alcohol dehydrogenase family)|uniref:SDR family NAD(P)-dependent oxidoreductase n=1 Tax=Pseudomaricurvus alkylphenolicus TaxID=1306991 RepID=UPI00141DA8EE|nr:glucose 1-dehydrogenase [Pseudomaricurvus alkylphenolicus]NIB38885.1 SDR family oxidoreductase [Pseudomaricurvus alkylphenolicus]